MNKKVKEDLNILKSKLVNLPRLWDGKQCILELKDANYNWKQMEWWAFYFEFICITKLRDEFVNPGNKFGNVKFDLSRNINWDLKSSAIKSHNHHVIMNDVEAMNLSIERNGYHGEIIALCDVEYNDENRTFQKWHNELKGGMSDYEKQRVERTSISRYRKTKATLEEVLILILNKKSLTKLDVMNQGRNSNGKPRKIKYLLNLEEIDKYIFEKIIFE